MKLTLEEARVLKTILRCAFDEPILKEEVDYLISLHKKATSTVEALERIKKGAA